MLTVYLTRHKIQAAEVEKNGGGVRSAVEMELPMGVLMSGEIANEEKLTELIAEFWSKNSLPARDVFLVMDSGQLVDKYLESPLIKKNAMQDYLGPEFAEMNHSEDAVYGYQIIFEDKKKKRRELLATQASRAFLDQVITMFSNAGVEVTEICSPLCAILASAFQVSGIRDQVAVIQHWNGSTLINLLVRRGVYTYSSTAQVFQAPGTPGFSLEAARQVSRLNQFMKAQQLEETITHVYLSGMMPDDCSYCEEGIREMFPDVTVQELEGDLLGLAGDRSLVSDYLLPVGAACLGGDYVGLCQAKAIDREKIRDRRDFFKRLRPVIALAVVCLAVVLITTGIHLSLRLRLAALVDYNTSPSVVAAVAEADRLVNENGVIESRLDELNGDAEAEGSYPLADSAVIEEMERFCGSDVELSISSYDAARGQFSVETIANNVDIINRYISDLRKQDIFTDVYYTGYYYDDDLAKYVVNVVCTLSPQAGR